MIPDGSDPNLYPSMSGNNPAPIGFEGQGDFKKNAICDNFNVENFILENMREIILSNKNIYRSNNFS